MRTVSHAIYPTAFGNVRSPCAAAQLKQGDKGAGLRIFGAQAQCTVDAMDAYLPVLVMIAAGVLFGLTNLLLAERLGPRRPVWRKLTTYESGMEPIRTARERFSVKFYMVAMVFIVFDIEIVFMYPWAVQFRQLGAAGLVAMALFIGLLLAGLVYVWRKGVLQWN
jgi:NADH-quinone oxidoreductase subunit A